IFVSLDLLIFRVRMTEDLSAAGRMLSSITSAPLAFDDKAAAEEMLASLAGRSNIERAGLYDQKGQLFASFKGGAAACPAAVPDQAIGAEFTRQHLSVLHDVSQGGRLLGRLFIEQGLSDYTARIRWHAAICVVVLLFCCLIVPPVVSPLQRLVLKPI